jgi:hypothetical protein
MIILQEFYFKDENSIGQLKEQLPQEMGIEISRSAAVEK